MLEAREPEGGGLAMCSLELSPSPPTSPLGSQVPQMSAPSGEFNFRRSCRPDTLCLLSAYPSQKEELWESSAVSSGFSSSLYFELDALMGGEIFPAFAHQAQSSEPLILPADF